jgi:hypothetical protein
MKKISNCSHPLPPPLLISSIPYLFCDNSTHFAHTHCGSKTHSLCLVSTGHKYLQSDRHLLSPKKKFSFTYLLSLPLKTIRMVYVACCLWCCGVLCGVAPRKLYCAFCESWWLCCVAYFVCLFERLRTDSKLHV